MARTIAILLLVALATALTCGVRQRLSELAEDETSASAQRAPAPVEVAPVEHGPLTLRRTFTGTLEAAAEFLVSPKVSGRLRSVEVDLGDPVERGQVVARIDDDELVEATHQAEAELAVARASHAEAKSALEIAERALRRVQALRGGGVLSESQLDATQSDELAARAHVEVTRASVARAEAALETTRIRLGYTSVRADWSGGDDRRVVAERYVDEGGTVSTSTALLSIAELDPVVAVLYVPERDYAHLAVGQRATLRTDSHADETFEGHVTRIAPVFRRATRQARVELRVANADERLKPGMFARATLELERIPDATSVPLAALTERDGATGVFALDEQARVVHWRPVEVGIQDGERVEVRGGGLGGRVVVLGQELCDDGAPVAPSDAPPGAGPPGER